MGNDGFGVLGVADINAGIALKNNIGFGLSYIGWNALSSCCATNASGVGVQLRIKSHKRLIFKIELGYILNAYYGDDGPYRFEYNYEKSNKLYFRLSPTLRFGNFTTGLTWVSTKGQINDNFDYKSGAFIGKQPFTVSSLSLAIGFTIPK